MVMKEKLEDEYAVLPLNVRADATSQKSDKRNNKPPNLVFLGEEGN